MAVLPYVAVLRVLDFLVPPWTFHPEAIQQTSETTHSSQFSMVWSVLLYTAIDSLHL